MPGSPAETCRLLHVNDELLAVNGQDVSQMDHSDIVSLIKSSGLAIHLTVQQPDPRGQQAAPSRRQTLFTCRVSSLTIVTNWPP